MRENRVILKGTIKSFSSLVANVQIPKAIGEVDSIDEYAGKYNVMPTLAKQTLKTKNKKMANDVVVEPIPYYEVSNEQNGSTIIIGGK